MTSSIENREKTHYALLGVTKGSSLQQIKAAYRKLSLKAHPDRGGSNDAQARINHAYEILSDPARRRRYDMSLSVHAAGTPAKEQRRSRQAEEWERGFRAGRAGKNMKDRVREEVKRRSEEIRSGFSRKVEDEYADACGDFRRMRSRFALSAAGVCVFLAAGFLHPLLWAGAAATGYLLYRNARYGAGDDAFLVFNPEWSYILKRRARRKVTLETEAIRTRLEELPEIVNRLFTVLRKSSFTRDDEKTLLNRMLVHFFMLGYVPVRHDAVDRIVIAGSGDGRIAIRYRHRTGAPANAAFINKLHDYMDKGGTSRGFLYASPGISKNAAKLAEKLGIVHYTTRDLNAWISGTSSGHYPGPEGDILGQIESFMAFLS